MTGKVLFHSIYYGGNVENRWKHVIAIVQLRDYGNKNQERQKRETGSNGKGREEILDPGVLEEATYIKPRAIGSHQITKYG